MMAQMKRATIGTRMTKIVIITISFLGMPAYPSISPLGPRGSCRYFSPWDNPVRSRRVSAFTGVGLMAWESRLFRVATASPGGGLAIAEIAHHHHPAADATDEGHLRTRHRNPPPRT